MAVIAPVVTGGKLDGNPPRGTEVIQYGPMGTGDTTTPFEAPNFGDKTVTLSGTFGTETVSIQGANEGDTVATAANFTTLHNAKDGNPLAFTVADIAQILENPRYIKVLITGGAGGSGLRVTFMCRRDKGLKQTG